MSQNKLTNFEKQIHNDLKPKAVCKGCSSVAIALHDVKNARYERCVANFRSHANEGMTNRPLYLEIEDVVVETGTKVMKVHRQQPTAGSCVPLTR